MKLLSYVCLAVAAVVFVLGIVSKFVLHSTVVQPASFLLLMQVVLLFGVVFILHEISGKK